MFVKICGVTNLDDALMAAGLGADAVGLMFAASQRRITAGRARDIARRLPPEVLTVGVFRDETKERVTKIANEIGLGAVQLHGSESAADIRWIGERVPRVIRSFSADSPALMNLEDYGPCRLLVDSATPGGGKVFDWAILEGAPLNRPFILAGGLSPENVVEAISIVGPWGVDVSTGVESSPGTKDPIRTRDFIVRAKASAQTERSNSTDIDGGVKPFNWEEDSSWR